MRALLFFLIFLTINLSFAQKYIYTVAGVGAGDGNPATLVGIGNVSSVILDGSGNLFFSEQNKGLIRKVDLSTGLIVTIAGKGISGYGGDGGDALNARFYIPSGIAFGLSGDLYVADQFNHRIRKIAVSTGVVTTVAGTGLLGYSGDGGLATSARLNNPSSVTIDQSGNLFISDKGNNRIRKVDLTTLIITTVAGNGAQGYDGDGGLATSAQLNNPVDVTIDVMDNVLYIVDSQNHRIRKINLSTGVIETAAGSGSGGYSGDSGIATSAQLNNPRSIVIDSKGDFFISDKGNNRIRKVEKGSGIITTIAGNGVGSYSGDGGLATNARLFDPNGIALDSFGNLFIVDTGNKRIRKVTAATGIISTIVGNGTLGFNGDGISGINAQLNGPTGLSLDLQGNLYVADQFNQRIRMIAGGTGVITTVAGNGTVGYNGEGIQAVSAKLNYPAGLVVDAFGNLFFAEIYNHRVRKIVLSTGVVTTVAGNGIAGFSGDNGLAINAQLNNPTGLTLDGSGNLYIADFSNKRIRKVSLGTGLISTAAGNGVTGYSGDGDLAVNAQLSGSVYGVAVNATGDLYIADYGNHRIRKVDGSGIITTVVGSGTIGFSGDGGNALSAKLNGPIDIVLDAFGNLYFSDYSNNRLRKVDPSGTISTIAGIGTIGFVGDGGLATNAQLAFPYGITVDALNTVYFSDYFNQRVRKISGQPQFITFNKLDDVTFGAVPVILNAMSSSGLPVSYTSSNTSVVTVNDNSMTIVGAGTATITATQPGNTNYASALPVEQTIMVKRANQVINFGSLSNTVFGALPQVLKATSTSNLQVVYSSSNNSVASLNGTELTIVGAGTCVILASQAGNGNYNAAEPVAQTLAVNKADQTIIFSGIPNVTLGASPMILSASASSGLPVSYSSSDITKATVNGSSLTFLNTGSVTLTASQIGDNNYNLAANMNKTFCINPTRPTITLNATNPSTPMLTSSSLNGNQWYRNGLAILGATSSTYTITDASLSGDYTVIVSADTCFSQPSASQVVLITGDLTFPKNEMLIYPNPVENSATVSLEIFQSSSVEVSLFDALGVNLVKWSVAGGEEFTFDTNDFSRGVYILKATQGTVMKHVKFVKK